MVKMRAANSTSDNRNRDINCSCIPNCACEIELLSRRSGLMATVGPFLVDLLHNKRAR